MYQNKGAATFF